MPRNNPDWENHYTNPKMMPYPAEGSVLKDRYRLLKVLKKGGMSTVYQAEDMQMQHSNMPPVFVAIKVIMPYLIDDFFMINMLQEEALLNMERLSGHPNIVHVHSYDEDKGYHFLIMEWLEGHDLEDELKQQKKAGSQGLPLMDVMGYLDDIVSALSFAHKRGVIHRDIKLSNLFKCHDDKVVLLDFGVARSIDESNVSLDVQFQSGCYEYMSPEADIASHEATPKDDVYSLAICIYQLLSGELPFKGRAASHREQSQEDHLPKPCKELSDAQWIVLKNAFTINKEERKVRTAKDFKNLFVNPDVASTSPPTFNYARSSPRIGKPKRPFHIIRVLFLIVLFTGISYSAYIWQNKDRNYIKQETITRTPVASTPPSTLTKISGSETQSADNMPVTQVITEDLQQGERPEIFSDSIIEMDFLLVKAGSFVMGSPDGSRAITEELNRDKDEKQHEVIITEDYYLAKYEVTQIQWESIMGANPSHFVRCGSDCPVENISWNEVQTYILRLNKVLQKANKNYRYRLPTEAEWEYAARAGTREASYNGDFSIFSINNIPVLDEIAWYAGNSEATYVGAYDCSKWSGMQYETIKLCGTQPVGGKVKNSWGFYDMLGNVWEWVSDNYGAYPDGTATNPNRQSKGNYRVFRGGSWSYNGSFCRVAKRNKEMANYKKYNLGFRLARDAL